MWRRRLRYYILTFLRLKDSPRLVALGFALGACVNFIPTFGLGVVISGFLAGLFRVNIPSSLLGQLLFTPLFPILFYFNFLMGNLFYEDKTIDLEWCLNGQLFLDKEMLADLGQLFFVGAFLNILITGAILYIVILKVFVSYRKELAHWYLAKRIPRKLGKRFKKRKKLKKGSKLKKLFKLKSPFKFIIPFRRKK